MSKSSSKSEFTEDFFRFSGTANRKEFWVKHLLYALLPIVSLFLLAILLLAIQAVLISGQSIGISSFYSDIMLVGSIVASIWIFPVSACWTIPLIIRRMRSIGIEPWLYPALQFLCVIPLTFQGFELLTPAMMIALFFFFGLAAPLEEKLGFNEVRADASQEDINQYNSRPEFTKPLLPRFQASPKTEPPIREIFDDIYDVGPKVMSSGKSWKRELKVQSTLKDLFQANLRNSAFYNQSHKNVNLSSFAKDLIAAAKVEKPMLFREQFGRSADPVNISAFCLALAVNYGRYSNHDLFLASLSDINREMQENRHQYSKSTIDVDYMEYANQILTQSDKSL